MMIRNFVIAILCIGFLASPVAAQSQDADTFVPVVSSNPFENFARDHLRVLKSPLHIQQKDLRWLIPLGAGTAALLATDSKAADMAREAEGVRPASRFLSHLGGAGPLAAASASFYGLGKLTGNNKAAETGKRTAESLLHTQAAIMGMKMIFGRERPDKVGGEGRFWNGGQSFPSGHAASSFAFATVVARQYKEKKLVAIGAYGLATAVSLSRVGGLRHHPSDVLIGAAVGHLIGRFVTRSPSVEY